MTKPTSPRLYRLRLVILKLLCWLAPSLASRLFHRANLLHVGLSGNISLLDKSVARDKGLKELTGFWLWVFSPYISEAKPVHKSAFRQACLEVLGEDPDEW